MDGTHVTGGSLPALTHRVTNALRDNAPKQSASYGLTGFQAIVLICLVINFVTVILQYPQHAFHSLWLSAVFGFTTLSLFRLLLAHASKPTPITELNHSRTDWPVYSVIVPLFHEAAVLPRLMQRLSRINYPRDRLDVIFAVEACDTETRAALSRLTLPTHIRVIVIPDGVPRTKPRACAVALELAHGQYVAIYDAEDAPHPQQLKHAVETFETADEKTICLQAPLNIDHAHENWLTRQFALEYAAQFHVMLPGMARLGLPIALGGTSNHFRTQALKDIGSWDPYNVTEDADLGFRLAAMGYTCGFLNCPTYEEAPISLTVWLKQRSRWIKGYMQTWGVRMRSPLDLIRQTGLQGFLTLHLTIGAAIVSAFVHAPLMGLAVYVLIKATVSDGPQPFSLADMLVVLSSYGVWLLIAAMGARRLGIKNLAYHALLTPLYWPLQSIAAVMALWDLIHRPYHWQKTPHGLSVARVL